ncbi:HAMP domain-containing sensor histidine kinase [Streptomyces sp. B93]|uniref:sensor histidine kinase n=1 Tax=Streptomyces sp. B93 TaxID=2824875 RepID=UPI001B39582B|nr:HAMP domain-containing sensor histidine kinase [Streptomyces sp. B93]MBQ1090073.1 HAMP domain-containing histidine kinase [Streptomyces sp. B93]
MRTAERRTAQRRSLSTRVIGSLVAVFAVLALVMVATIALLMAYVPTNIVGGAPAVAPGRTSGGPPPSTSASGPLLPRREVDRLLVFSAVALAGGVVSGAFVVRRIVRRSLAPLGAMTDAARQAATTDLRARVPLGRTQDEITDLAVTFNIMLARLDDAFEAQRRFAANASHELRTPLATTQAVIDDALAHMPHGSTRDLLRDLRTLNSRSVHTVRTLLDLAETQASRGPLDRVDLTLVVRREAEAQRATALANGVTMSENLGPAVVDGEAPMIQLMVRNLLDNAVRHNYRGGEVELHLCDESPGILLRVANTGAAMTPEEVTRITEPFHRGAGRLGRSGGGLGAALVAAVVTRHGWRLHLLPRPDGGLIAEVRMPRSA